VTEVPEKDSVDEKDDKKSVKEDKKTKKTHVEVENEKLKARVAELEQKVKSDAEEYLKARADLDNIRKRLIEQSKEDRKYASQSLINDLITPLDMLSKVINMTQNPTPEVQNFLFGFKMISDQINDILSRDGVKEIKALNEEFDPKFMQAMSKEKVDGVKPGQVIEVLQTGYMYKEHLLRPAMVKVSE
jgi:molecular chaperone GrpE